MIVSLAGCLKSGKGPQLSSAKMLRAGANQSLLLILCKLARECLAVPGWGDLPLQLVRELGNDPSEKGKDRKEMTELKAPLPAYLFQVAVSILV